MNNTQRISAMLMAASLLSACSSMPKNNPLLEDARSNYQAAQHNPEVIQLAPLELKQAGDALTSANAAWENRESDENVNRLTYLAKQKIATSQELARQRSAEIAVTHAAQERNQALLAQRTLEADKARLNTAVAQQQTKMAQNDAAVAQRQAMDAEARTRQLETQLNDLAAQKTERGYVVTFGDVLFNTDKAQLKADGMSIVNKLSEILRQNPQRVVLIEGFTDSTGSAAHNQELSEQRAMSVAAALVENGVSRDRVAGRGYGETYPVASNDSVTGRQLNRRVEIVLSDDNGKILPR